MVSLKKFSFKYVTILLIITFITISIGYQNSLTISDSSDYKFNDKLKIQTNTPVPKPTRDELNQYNISVIYDPSTHSTTGWTNVSFLNKESLTVSNLILHLWGNDVESNSITIHNVYNENNMLLSFAILNNKLNISTIPILQNQRFIANINFTVNLPNIPSRFGYSDETHLTQAFGNWYPILAVRENGDWNLNPYVNSGESFYSEMSYIDVNITSDNSEVIAGAGDLESVSINSDEYTYHYTAGPVRDFTWIASPDYLIYSELHNGVNISSYYYPEDSERGILAVDVAKKSLDLFSNIFEPYPYNSMAVSEIADAWFGGMEYNQLVMINNIYYNDTERTYDRFEDVISHEWAHTWNTYLTGNNPYLDPWLDESWAMFSSSLYFEEYYSIDWYNGRHDFLRQDYLDFANSPDDRPLATGMDYWDFHPGSYQVIYVKGMIIMDMLRYVMGDTAFFEAIIDYYDTYTYSTVTTNDFIEIFSSHINDDITWFFDQFFYDTIVLDYDITSATMYKNDSSNNWDITLEVLNVNNDDSPPTMKVPVRVQSVVNSNFNVIVNETTNVIHVSVSQSLGKPQNIYIDPDWQLLRESKVIRSTIIETDTPGVIISVTSTVSTTSSSNNSSKQSTIPTTNVTLLLSIASITIFVLIRRKRNHQ